MQIDLSQRRTLAETGVSVSYSYAELQTHFRKTVQIIGPALLENNEAYAKLTTANGETFTSSSGRLSSQSR